MSFLSFNMKLKFLSFTTPSTPSFDATNRSSPTTAGCLAAILRRILCSRSLPSDHYTDTQVTSFVCEKHSQLESKENSLDKVMPSVVARLMGLEEFPNASPASLTRSRSMNSLDVKPSNHQMQGDNKHRRVQSATLPIPEMPTFFEIENEEFFVLSFGNGNEDKEKRSRRKKSKMGYGESEQRREERWKNRNKKDQVIKKKVSKVLNENELCRKVSDIPEKPCFGLELMEFSTPINKNEVSDGAKLSKKEKKKKVNSIEIECSSEDSSPVSVLDFDRFIMSELDPKLGGSTSRRKLSPEPDGNYECQSQRNDNKLMNIDARKTRTSEGKCVGSRKRDFQSQKYLDICDKIFKLTEAEVADESNWLCRRHVLRYEDSEDICEYLELKILDQSLDELVHQLVGLAM